MSTVGWLRWRSGNNRGVERNVKVLAAAIIGWLSGLNVVVSTVLHMEEEDKHRKKLWNPKPMKRTTKLFSSPVLSLNKWKYMMPLISAESPPELKAITIAPEPSAVKRRQTWDLRGGKQGRDCNKGNQLKTRRSLKSLPKKENKLAQQHQHQKRSKKTSVKEGEGCAEQDERKKKISCRSS